MKRILQIALPLTLAAAAAAAQGMWMPQQVPELAGRLKESGLEIDPTRLADLTGFPMGAIVSTGGCSASFVSPEGLIATNHHCVYGYLQYNSSAERDLLTNGFLAGSRAEEIQASPDAKIFVTTRIEDVTAQVLSRLDRMSDGVRAQTIERRRKELVASCEKPGGVRCRVDSFFAGTQYLRTTQMEILDVRLVYAPSQSIGNHGGEIDNWMWPRHTGDFGFLRAYVGPDGRPAAHSADNVPFHPRHWLKVSSADLDEGDFVMLVGYPGTTYRYETAEETRDRIDFSLPESIRYREALIEILEREGERGRAVGIANASRIRSLANLMKKYRGTLEAFERADFLSRRTEEESRMRSLMSNDPELVQRHGEVMAELRSIFARERATRERETVLAWLYAASPMLTQADTLYELSRQRAKKDVERDADYQERNWSVIRSRIARAQRTVEPGSDRAGLRNILQQAVALPENQRIEAVDAALAATGKATTEEQIDAFLDGLYGGTKIADRSFREDLFDDTTAQIAARNDSMIVFAADLRKLVDANKARKQADDGAFARLRPHYMEALRAVRGELLAPDANGTLRVSFAEVKGYEPRDAVRYAPFTTAEGILEKETGEAPFNAPPALLSMIRAKRFGPYADPDLGSLPVAFLATGDITNGSSGSATLNGKGELVGLAFDGNYESMGFDFVVNPEISRSIHVDSRYMLWVMDAVDQADHLLREMGIEPRL
ncbi:MAG TPA: S46 family peptidase [Thermoanaerobaculia bacterium]|nr:S46 family peptidase [Thermoanaerobaculia bacterium]